jgi:hypothetical protein
MIDENGNEYEPVYNLDPCIWCGCRPRPSHVFGYLAWSRCGRCRRERSVDLRDIYPALAEESAREEARREEADRIWRGLRDAGLLDGGGFDDDDDDDE